MFLQKLFGKSPPSKLPPLSLLSSPSKKVDAGNLKKNTDIIEETLNKFGIKIQIKEISIGPRFVRYEAKLLSATRLAELESFSDELKKVLSCQYPVKMELPIPDKFLIGIIVPRKSSEPVLLKTMLETIQMKEPGDKLTVPLGMDIIGEPKVESIYRMPHVLIAGSTVGGKSVLVNSWLISLIYRNSPQEVKFILIDPKKVELSLYNNIPYLVNQVINNPKEAIESLKWSVGEMEKRYKAFQKHRVRNISDYNKFTNNKPFAYIIIVIDDIDEIISRYPSQTEELICRLAQLSRATGIHMVTSTQKLNDNILTGLIKANIPTRIAFMVTSEEDSKTILDMPGAQQLLGEGDMLYLAPDKPFPVRLQSAYVSENEIREVVKFLKK